MFTLLLTSACFLVSSSSSSTACFIPKICHFWSVLSFSLFSYQVNFFAAFLDLFTASDHFLVVFNSLVAFPFIPFQPVLPFILFHSASGAFLIIIWPDLCFFSIASHPKCHCIGIITFFTPFFPFSLLMFQVSSGKLITASFLKLNGFHNSDRPLCTTACFLLRFRLGHGLLFALSWKLRVSASSRTPRARYSRI